MQIMGRLCILHGEYTVNTQIIEMWNNLHTVGIKTYVTNYTRRNISNK